MIFHLTSNEAWLQSKSDGEYRAASLATEGFIHLSSYGQILAVANAFYKTVKSPVLLAIDNSKLKGELQWEGDEGMEFPHLYRSIRCDEVNSVISIALNSNNEFVSNADLDFCARSVRLQSERLLLREFQFEDFDQVHSYAQDADLTKFMPWGPNTRNETRAFLARKFKEQCQAPRSHYDFAVVDKLSGEFLGSAGLFVRSNESEVGYIGYILKSSAHGKGVATEMSRTLLEFGFGELRLNRIEATCDHDNSASFRVMEKLGMKQEGLLRENLLTKGRRRSTLIYGILKSEFKK